MDDKEWHKSFIYNEVDSIYGVEDVIGSYHFTDSNRMLALSCAQRQRFLERDIASVES